MTPSGSRTYSPSEIRADAIVHGAGVILGLAGSAALLVHVAATQPAAATASVAVYLFGLLTMLTISAAYNLTPRSPLHWKLRPYDHSAIYLLIAATYTPLLMFLTDTSRAWTLGVAIWLGAALGAAAKFLFPGRHDGLAVAVYLALGWAGAVEFRGFMAVLPPATVTLIAAGGLLYTAGVVFHLWESLKFQNAIWHAFVAAAAACHFAAIAALYP
jgi:hemolysin III